MTPLWGNNLKGTEIMWEDFLFLFQTFFSTEQNKSTDFILLFCKNVEKQAFPSYFSILNII